MMSSTPKLVMFLYSFEAGPGGIFQLLHFPLACHWNYCQVRGQPAPGFHLLRAYRVIKKKMSILRTPFENFKSNQYIWNGENLLSSKTLTVLLTVFSMSMAHAKNGNFSMVKRNKRRGLLTEETITIHLLQG